MSSTHDLVNPEIHKKLAESGLGIDGRPLQNNKYFDEVLPYMPKEVFPTKEEMRISKIDELVAKIKWLHGKIDNIALYDDQFHTESITDLQKQVIDTHELLHTARREKLAVGDWVQVFVADSDPFYGKVKEIQGNFVALCGIFNHDKNTRQGFEKDVMLSVSRELARALEFECGNNRKII